MCITIAANIADTAILGIDACFPDSVLGFIADEKKSDVRFVKYLFDLLQVRIKQISQGAAQDNLSLEKLETIKFDVPPLATQRRIASILSAYDDLIENNLRRIALLEEMARQTYEEWFVRMRFPGWEEAEWDGDLPLGWERVEIQEISNVITGKTPSTFQSKYYGNDILFIKTPDLHSNIYIIDTSECLSFEGANSQKNKFFPKNTTLLSCIGAGAGAIGLTSKESQCNQQINGLICKNEVFTFYIYFFCRGLTPTLRALGSNGATMTNVSKGKLEKVIIIKPSLKIVSQFHFQVESQFEIILSLQTQNRLLREARDILLPRLMSGVLEV